MYFLLKILQSLPTKSGELCPPQGKDYVILHLVLMNIKEFDRTSEVHLCMVLCCFLHFTCHQPFRWGCVCRRIAHFQRQLKEGTLSVLFAFIFQHPASRRCLYKQRQQEVWNFSFSPLCCQAAWLLLTEDLRVLLRLGSPPLTSVDLINAKPLTLSDYQTSEAECNELALLIPGLTYQPLNLMSGSHVNY